MSEETIVAVINLQTGLVENIAVVRDGDGSTAPAGFQFVPSDEAGIGDSWDGSQIVKAAPVEVPISAEVPETGVSGVKVLSTSDRLDALETRMTAIEAKLG